MSLINPDLKMSSSPASGQEATQSSPAVQRTLTRGKWTYYGDGLIEYEYTPRIGRVQRVCGILGKDKIETIEIVKKGFPDLSEIDVGRFDFEIYNHRGLWVRVMDEAWDLLNRDPPLVWVIKIKELPEERDQRMKQQGSCFMITVVVIIAVVVVLFSVLMT